MTALLYSALWIVVIGALFWIDGWQDRRERRSDAEIDRHLRG